MHPTIHVSWVAVLVAVVVAFVFGFLWYGPLFGKKWAALMKFPPDMKPDRKAMMRGMVLMVIGTFFTAYTLTFMSEIWRPSVWGGAADAPAYLYATFTGFWVWLGFYVPMGLSRVAWEGGNWPLFGLNMSYAFLNLQIIAAILQYLR